MERATKIAVALAAIAVVVAALAGIAVYRSVMRAVPQAPPTASSGTSSPPAAPAAPDYGALVPGYNILAQTDVFLKSGEWSPGVREIGFVGAKPFKNGDAVIGVGVIRSNSEQTQWALAFWKQYFTLGYEKGPVAVKNIETNGDGKWETFFSARASGTGDFTEWGLLVNSGAGKLQLLAPPSLAQVEMPVPLCCTEADAVQVPGTPQSVLEVTYPVFLSGQLKTESPQGGTARLTYQFNGSEIVLSDAEITASFPDFPGDITVLSAAEIAKKTNLWETYDDGEISFRYPKDFAVSYVPDSLMEGFYPNLPPGKAFELVDKKRGCYIGPVWHTPSPFYLGVTNYFSVLGGKTLPVYYYGGPNTPIPTDGFYRVAPQFASVAIAGTTARRLDASFQLITLGGGMLNMQKWMDISVSGVLPASCIEDFEFMLATVKLNV